MSVAWGILLGVVQGLTEFLPVSSSGHLVILQGVFGLKSPGIGVEVAAHLGTLLAVLVVYGREAIAVLAAFVAGIGGAGGRRTRRTREFKMAMWIAVASVPAGAAGLLLKDALEKAFESVAVAGFGLLCTGVMLWLASSTSAKPGVPHPAEMGPGRAFFIGVAQAVALVPGISRSGSTISAGVMAGLRREDAAMFSFLMAIPAVGGAAVLDLGEFVAAAGTGGVPTAVLVAVTATAAVSGLFALRWLIGLLRRGSLRPFAVYCLAAGFVALLTAWIPGR